MGFLNSWTGGRPSTSIGPSKKVNPVETGTRKLEDLNDIYYISGCEDAALKILNDKNDELSLFSPAYKALKEGFVLPSEIPPKLKREEKKAKEKQIYLLT